MEVNPQKIRFSFFVAVDAVDAIVAAIPNLKKQPRRG